MHNSPITLHKKTTMLTHTNPPNSHPKTPLANTKTRHFPTFFTTKPLIIIKNPTHHFFTTAALFWHWKILALMPKSDELVGSRLGEEASHCLSAASFGLRAKAAAHGPAKILHSLDLFCLLFCVKTKK